MVKRSPVEIIHRPKIVLEGLWLPFVVALILFLIPIGAVLYFEGGTEMKENQQMETLQEQSRVSITIYIQWKDPKRKATVRQVYQYGVNERGNVYFFEDTNGFLTFMDPNEISYMGKEKMW